MKKRILVMATITIEGDNLTKNLITIILTKIKQYFAYKYRSKDSTVEIVHFELSDNYVELP
jgi:hypothetical protein|tara:strand:+ start:1017 stop:1199 length:183 start_codon:yes stop_codon:yes gene_type:complete